jgi:hypothetical protein
MLQIIDRIKRLTFIIVYYIRISHLLGTLSLENVESVSWGTEFIGISTLETPPFFLLCHRHEQTNSKPKPYHLQVQFWCWLYLQSLLWKSIASDISVSSTSIYLDRFCLDGLARPKGVPLGLKNDSPNCALVLSHL